MVIGFLKFKVTLAGAILTLDHCLCNFASRYQGQKKDLEFDIEQSSDRVLQWKAHLLRAINQERAKSKILANLEKHQCLIVMDWAMKWLPKRFRETQSEWFGKKSISWHVSACITRTENTDMEFEVIGI